MSRQSGNFLLQALLALSLIFAFIPFFASHLSSRDTQSRMYAVSRAVDTASTAARIFIRENAKNLRYDKTVVAGDDFVDLLEPYGLPLGFSPRTTLGQDIALVINKTTEEVSAHLELSGGDLTGVQRAELARRIGFYANVEDDVIVVGVALDDGFSDLVRRNETNIEASAFLNDLDMGGFVLDNVGRALARRGEFDSASVGTLTVTGTENGRKVKNKISDIAATRASFQSKTGEAALSLVRGTLIADSIDARTIARFGDGANFEANTASVYDFSMTAGRSGFVGPANWDIRGSVITDRVTFSVERLDVSAYINASRGQDVYITDDLEYSTRSGIETSVILASNITMRDQTSSSLSSGGNGAVLLDIRPAGTTLLPDVLVRSIDNDDFEIIAKASDDGDKMIDCKDVINALRSSYNSRSLSQHIICQYVFWNRLEERIDIKQCMMEGRNGCV